MAVERPDWIDDVMRRGPAWEPPPAFADRVVRAAMIAGVVAHPVFPLPAVSLASRLRESARGAAASLIVRLQGTVWVVRQYRELIWG